MYQMKRKINYETRNIHYQVYYSSEPLEISSLYFDKNM